MLKQFGLLGEGRAKVFKNFFALVLLQGTNFIIPLIIMPYLITTIGIDGYGMVNFVQAIMVYFASITEYGFQASATRDLANAKKNPEMMSRIFSSVLVTKLLLLVVSFAILFVLVLSFSKFSVNTTAFLFGFFIVIGQTVLPVWFFQGVEEMKFITYLNVAAKLLFTILIFAFVKEDGDGPLVLLFLGLGNFISGIFGVFLAVKKYHLNFNWPGIKGVKQELKNGWDLFVANFSIVSYQSSNVFILGLFTSNLITGYYSVAEKIVLAIKQLLTVFLQATYPHVCQLATESVLKVKRFYKQVFLPFSFLIFLVSICIFFFANPIVQFFTNEGVEEIVVLLRLLCFTGLIVALNIPAYQSLLANHFNKSASRILVIGSLLNILLNLILAPTLGASGTVYSVLITEIFITLGLHLVLYFKHPTIRLF